MLGKMFCSIARALGGCNPLVVESQVENIILPAELKSNFPVYKTSWGEIRKQLAGLGLEAMTDDNPDVEFFYTDEETWERIIPYLTYPAKYFAETERKDCDDYSKKASADSSFYFGVNCVQVWGDSPYGFHAFNLIAVAQGWKIFEPNAGYECAGELMDLENKYGWVPRKWKP